MTTALLSDASPNQSVRRLARTSVRPTLPQPRSGSPFRMRGLDRLVLHDAAAPVRDVQPLERTPSVGRRCSAESHPRDLAVTCPAGARRARTASGVEPDRKRHLMISSARANTGGGMVRPRALAVLRLITSSNFVGCSTGRSAGLAPLRMRLHVRRPVPIHTRQIDPVAHEVHGPHKVRGVRTSPAFGSVPRGRRSAVPEPKTSHPGTP